MESIKGIIVFLITFTICIYGMYKINGWATNEDRNHEGKLLELVSKSLVKEAIEDRERYLKIKSISKDSTVVSYIDSIYKRDQKEAFDFKSYIDRENQFKSLE